MFSPLNQRKMVVRLRSLIPARTHAYAFRSVALVPVPSSFPCDLCGPSPGPSFESLTVRRLGVEPSGTRLRRPGRASGARRGWSTLLGDVDQTPVTYQGDLLARAVRAGRRTRVGTYAAGVSNPAPRIKSPVLDHSASGAWSLLRDLNTKSSVVSGPTLSH